MSQAKFTASERADKCVLSLEQAIYQTTKRERGLVGAICSIYGLNYTRYPRKSIQTTTATHYHQTPSSAYSRAKQVAHHGRYLLRPWQCWMW